MTKIARTVEIDEAKKQLSELVDQASEGEEFIIARAGQPLVEVVPIDAPIPKKVRRLGFMSGRIAAPEDFDEMAVRRSSRFEGENEG